jgi:hypothetical protein
MFHRLGHPVKEKKPLGFPFTINKSIIALKDEKITYPSSYSKSKLYPGTRAISVTSTMTTSIGSDIMVTQIKKTYMSTTCRAKSGLHEGNCTSNWR